MTYAQFNALYFQCRDLLPDQKLKALFDAAMIGGMSAYVPDHRVKLIMELALDTAQNFTPQMQQ